MNQTQVAVKFLNEAFEADPYTIKLIVNNRYAANRALQVHPTIQVTNKGAVGFLGILNGLMETLGNDRVAAIYNEAGELDGFTSYKS